jgi:PhnB protein
MQVNAHLNFNGNCEAAFKFYAEALNGTIEAMVPMKEPRPGRMALPNGARRSFTPR